MTAKQKANRERFKKVVAEAAKLRKKNPKLTQAQAVKQAWAKEKKSEYLNPVFNPYMPDVNYSQRIKKAAKRKIGEKHTDTKSHNVNIRVVSGIVPIKKGQKAKINYSGLITEGILLHKTKDYLQFKFINPITKKIDIGNFLYTDVKNVISGWRKGGTAIIEHNEEKLPKLKNVRVRRVPKKDPFDKPGTFKKFTTLAGLFDTKIIADIDSLKKEYFKLAKKYHPDAGGTTEQMQQLNAEYENLLKKLLSGSGLSEEQKKNEIELDEALRKVIDELVILEGINIEIVGKWIWVSGNTYPVKDTFKKVGMFPVKKDNVFYWVYKGSESRGRGNLSMDEIKKKYGVEKIDIKPTKKLNGIINKMRLLSNLKKIKLALNKRPI